MEAGDTDNQINIKSLPVWAEPEPEHLLLSLYYGLLNDDDHHHHHHYYYYLLTTNKSACLFKFMSSIILSLHQAPHSFHWHSLQTKKYETDYEWHVLTCSLS